MLPGTAEFLPNASFFDGDGHRLAGGVKLLIETNIAEHGGVGAQHPHVRRGHRHVRRHGRLRTGRQIEVKLMKRHPLDHMSAGFRLETGQRLVAERTQALAAVSHDLRSPITRVRLRAEMLDDVAVRDLIDWDLAEMEEMIDSTLEFLRFGESTEAKRLVNLASIAETAVDNAADAGRTVSYHGADSVTVMGQHLALKRAANNLIGNALKYAQTVRVEIRSLDGFAELVVTDDGPGIPVESLDSVFDPFVRLETSRSKETGGVGLGLTIARSIARAHSGDVILTNNSSGGLLAKLRLPLSVAAGQSKFKTNVNQL